MWDVGSGSSSAITETHLAVENASALAFLGEPGLLIAHETGAMDEKTLPSKHHYKHARFVVSSPPGHFREISGTRSEDWGACAAGFAFVDPGSGKLMRQQYTKDVVATACGVSNGQKDQSDFFAGVGCNLVRYETRFAGAEAKSHAVGSSHALAETDSQGSFNQKKAIPSSLPDKPSIVCADSHLPKPRHVDLACESYVR